ncbi:hypothetical protein EKO04_003901 [Ascochyta lentis]|uniref:C2H2-type domain-containing protein n=1 Tax=Ascochyta lentis TaxID=205686 RepID=A0A8H7J767_9PLEO|nr:hypothetical protein EKO04_003901 [Ascochyta lentis]
MDTKFASGKLPPRFEVSSSTQIQQWQETTGQEQESHDLSIVARAIAICLKLLGLIVKHTPSSLISKSQQRLLGRRHKMLGLWAGGFGAADGRLDIVLDRSDDLKQTVLSVLSPMCRLLLKGLKTFLIPQAETTEYHDLCTSVQEVYGQMQLLVADANHSASDEDDETDVESDADKRVKPSVEIGKMINEINVYVQCLVDLGAALQCPAVAREPDEHATARPLEERTANDYHAGLISNRYPRADTVLVERLGQISWSRFLRMQHERDNNTTERNRIQQPLVADATKSLLSISEFQDSGLGTSLPTALSSYAESTVSFMTSISGGERVRIPPLPSEGKKGVPFDCTACGRSVRATNNREWRKHLYTDLQPYTCFFTGCQFNESPFASRQMWSDHLELEHKLGPNWDALECPLCLDATGHGKSTVLTHFARHMEDIALVALPPTVDSDVDSDSSIESEAEAITSPEKGTEASGEMFQLSLLLTSGFERCRVKVYELRNNDWVDTGTGVCYHAKSDGKECLKVFQEDDLDANILTVHPTKDDGFQKQQDTVIVWTTTEGIDMALSFQKPESCIKIWGFLTKIVGYDDKIPFNVDKGKDTSAASPPEQNQSVGQHPAGLYDPMNSITGFVVASGKFMCSAPECTKLRFRRQADFQRHYRINHVINGTLVCSDMTKHYPTEAALATATHISDSDNDGDSEGLIIGCVFASGRFKCTNKACNDLRFRHQADFRRHHINVHALKEKEYFCPLLGCARSEKSSKKARGRSFGSRKDKMEEHVQKVHDSKIGCTESSVGPRACSATSDPVNVFEVDGDDIEAASIALSQHNSLNEGGSKFLEPPHKTTYVRPQHPKIKCQYCNERPEGFRGTHELDRHIARAHGGTRKGYICVAPSSDEGSLDNCKSCRNKKAYGAYYNAAAHLRRAHFNTRQQGPESSNGGKRDGIGGANHPAMDWLKKHWIQEIEVPNVFTPASMANSSKSTFEAEPSYQNLDLGVEIPDLKEDYQLSTDALDYGLGVGNDISLHDASHDDYQFDSHGLNA